VVNGEMSLRRLKLPVYKVVTPRGGGGEEEEEVMVYMKWNVNSRKNIS
jgi:hypothetical protein